MKKLDEETMIVLECQIPSLVEGAVKQARNNALSAGLTVVEAVDGKLIETHPDGTSVVLKILQPRIPVVPGQKLLRVRP